MTRTERLEEIRKRAEAATKGPWESKCRSVGNEGNDPAWPEKDFLQFHVRWTDGSEVEVVGPKEVTWGRGDFYGRDADFIAHAREDIPWLLSELERMDALYRSAMKICPICGAGPVPLTHDCNGGVGP
jgi:predicted metal-dependent phosphoesterase TrpH